MRHSRYTCFLLTIAFAALVSGPISVALSSPSLAQEQELEQEENKANENSGSEKGESLAPQSPSDTDSTGSSEEQPHASPPREEFIGFSPLDDQRSMGNDTFRGSTHSSLTDLIKSISPRSPHPYLHRMVNRILLTAARQSDIIMDSPPESGSDLLTLRLEKMLERGLYSEAASIYTTFDSEPYHERLATAGLTALIMTGRKSLACLDIKTFFEGQTNPKPWQDLESYCNHIMRAAAGVAPETTFPAGYPSILVKIFSAPGYAENYDPAVFDKLTQFERAVIIAENTLTVDIPALRESLKNGLIPPSHIQPLLQLDTLDLDTRMLLITHGIKSASVSYANLIALFKTAQIEELNTSPAATLIRIFKRIKAKEPDNDIPAMMRTSLRASLSIGPESMYPLLQSLESVDPSALDPLDYQAALLAFMSAGRDLSPLWKSSISKRELPQTIQPPLLRDSLVILTHIMGDTAAKGSATSKSTHEILQRRDLSTLIPLVDIIENIDKTRSQNNNSPKVYENGFDTSPEKGYTMASAVPKERLERAVRANAVGETVLLSNLVFRHASAESSSPDALIEVTGNLKAVGLVEEAQTITAQAILSAMEKE